MDAPSGPAAAAAAELSAPDLVAVRDLLLAHVPDVGPLRASLLAGGRSNLTYALTDGTPGGSLRRPPLGHVLATAHDMRREYRVMRALAPTAVPVPRTVLRVRRPGRARRARSTSWSASTASSTGPPPSSPSSTPSGARRLGARVRGHPRRPARGRPGSGRPGRLRAPGRATWPARCAVGAAAGRRPRRASCPGFDELLADRARRRRARHAARPAIVHGDYRLDNVIVGRRRPGSPPCGAGLGDGHPRRPARRPRRCSPLYCRAGGVRGRPGRGDPGRPRLPVGRRADRGATPSARGRRPRRRRLVHRPSPASSSR